jgi:hypothetical protein
MRGLYQIGGAAARDYFDFEKSFCIRATQANSFDLEKYLRNFREREVIEGGMGYCKAGALWGKTLQPLARSIIPTWRG